MTVYECPGGCDLRGDEIVRPSHGQLENGTTHYSRIIGVEDPYLYDGIAYWLCPDCGFKWARWEEPHPYAHISEAALKNAR